MSTKQFQDCILVSKKEYEKLLNKSNQKGGSLLPLDGPQTEDVKLEARRHLQEIQGETYLTEKIKTLEGVLYQVLVEKKKPPTGYTTGRLLNILKNARAKLHNIARNKKTVKNDINIVQIPAEQNQGGNEDGVVVIEDEDGPGPSGLKTPKKGKKATRNTYRNIENLLEDYSPDTKKVVLKSLLSKHTKYDQTPKGKGQGKNRKQTGSGIRKKRKKNISKKRLHHWKEVR